MDTATTNNSYQLNLFFSDIARGNTASSRIYRLLATSGWVGPSDIEHAARGATGRPVRDYMRRLRDLRNMGYQVLKRRDPNDPRNFQYRLVR